MLESMGGWKLYEIWTLTFSFVLLLHMFLCQTTDPTKKALYIRLSDGNGHSSGRVEVSRDNVTWGTVCDDFWDGSAADVVCRYFNFSWGMAHSLAYFGPGTPFMAIYLDEVICNGSEKSLLDCRANPWGKNNCNHQEDAGVSCFEHKSRLTNANSQWNLGSVEIFADNRWAEVCDPSWDDRDAGVLCRELGYVSGHALTSVSKDSMDFDIWMLYKKAYYNFKCVGNETSLLDCGKSRFTSSTCHHNSMAGAVCHTTELDKVDLAFDMRITEFNKGKIEVKHFGTWGHICTRHWTDIEAGVACRQKGYKGGVAFGTNITSDQIGWLPGLKCSGNESSIEHCNSTGWWKPVFGCKAASVLCFDISAPEITIAGGSFGRLDITYEGQKGTVCSMDKWRNNEARVACQEKGYADGKAILGVGGGTGKIFLSGVKCKGNEASILLCNNTGWDVYKNTECSPHGNDVGVICYNHIRLSQSDSNSSGIVEFIENGAWYGICGSDFTDNNAKVVCKELGFEIGKALPQGAYGKYYRKVVMPRLRCTGNESSIHDCSYAEKSSCSNRYYGYAVVSCYNGTLTDEPKFSLQSGKVGKSSYGVVSVNKYNVWGQVCSSFWLEQNSEVLCRQLGYKGGNATIYPRDRDIPVIVTDYLCKGNESGLTDCVEETGICYSSTVAGAVCFERTPPRVKVVDGSHYYGRVVIDLDGEEGTVCDLSWGQEEAEVVCRELNGNFISGEPYSVPPGSGEVFLSDVSCTGTEGSLLECLSGGWKVITKDACKTHQGDVGVYCFGNVRVVGGKKNPKFIAGRVEMMMKSRNYWVSVCAVGFDQIEADIICKEMGFENAQILAPGSFGTYNSRNYVTDLQCNATETSLQDCKFSTGVCPSSSYNYASVLCTKTGANPGTKIYLTDGYHGKVVIERYGINGTVCVDDWDEAEANVTCRSFGYAGGVVLGPPEVYSRNMPIWYSGFNCKGTEKTLIDCPSNTTISLSCMRSIKNAGVLCYNSTGVKIRLVNEKKKNYFGRVEVRLDGTWGTICDYDWTKYDARVLCRQLGYPDGRSFKGSHYGKGTGPVYLSGMFCDSTEDTLLSCPSKGWNKAQHYCMEHEHDAGVYCYRPVSVTPGESYGGLQVWNKNAYGMVCSDNFDDLDATVACRDMGYGFGKSLCCSAFGDINFMSVMTNVQCSGREVSFANCSAEKGVGFCNSGKYASIACSERAPSIDYGLRLANVSFGRIEIRYFDHWGYICSEGFNANDANVVCKQLGFAGGFGYLTGNKQSWSMFGKDIRWLSNLTCEGTENRLEECSNLDWGNVGVCSQKSFASAYCHKKKDAKNPEIRLTKGSAPSEGLVELKINEVWGTICGWSATNTEATVICRHLGYTYGMYVGKDYKGSGPVWISKMRCKGNESSIFECVVDLMGSTDYLCSRHDYDLAVKCYSNVRLSGASKLPNYGQLQVFNETGWYAVCDKDFSDVHAGIACRSMGYKSGRAQCCSAMGFYLGSKPIGVTNVVCSGNEKRFKECTYNHGQCETRNYVSLLCTDQDISSYDIKVQIPNRLFYGHVEVKRYGIWGSVCDIGWDNKDAQVVCKQLGFVTGNATKGSASRTLPTLTGSVNCLGTETNLRDCLLTDFGQDHQCVNRNTRAAIVCSKDLDGVQYRIGDETDSSGRAEIYLNGQWGTVCNVYWDDRDANVFCKQLPNFVGGIEARPRVEAPREREVWMTQVGCHGNETNFLDCEASWDPSQTRYCAHSSDAGVTCFKSVRLNRGNYRSNGIVEVYVNGRWGTVCSGGFKQKEADVACKILGFQHGLPLCCTPYGYSFRNVIMGSFSCKGNETHLTDCPTTEVYQQQSCYSQDYSSLVCYNGERTQKYSLQLIGRSTYTGQINVTYLGVEGRICSDNWDDRDARVVCRELGYPNGMAYHHYKSDLVFFEYSGPYWTSQVNCTGTEARLSDCPHIKFGEVRTCKNESYAGVLCYDNEGIYYELSGNNNRYGYVNVSVRGQWGTICGRYWDQREADVFCRQLGFSTGDARYGPYGNGGTGTVWEANFRCNGNEETLNKCSHEGWMVSQSQSCQSHKDDAGVFCYTNVKLSNGFSKKDNIGAVMLYQNRTWLRVCDTGFTDMSARMVCQELGYTDGRALCCSAFGNTADVVPVNYTLRCTGREKSIPECLRQEQCKTSQYASVVCFHSNDTVEEKKYTFHVEERQKGQVLVQHFGIQGRICSKDWDDNEAKVMCRRQGYMYGIAYGHDESSVMEALRGPYWLSGFNCTGNEVSLLDCPHNTRLSLGDCSSSHIASVLCYNNSGLSYRLANGGKHFGRVEMSIENVWGTVCDAYWDNREASVLCRQLNYTEGVAIASAAYGAGKGAIWLSHLQCTGKEKFLHQCPHRGFNDQFTEASWLLPVICDSHRDDASVFCYKNVRLNEGYNSPMGGLEVHHMGQWYGVCDTDFNDLAANIACKSLGLGYIDGIVIPGSAFGNLTGSIKISQVSCNGGEEDISNCTFKFNQTCASETYVSVFCSNKTIVDDGYKVRIAPDSLSSNVHGILEVKKGGIWGRVCMYGWDDEDANVACKHLGYAGGVAYLHIMKNRRPILLRGVQCNGTESELSDCVNSTIPDLENCNFNSNDAGVLCYKMSAVKYRLHNKNLNQLSSGRVEMSYDGVWGTVCSWSWQSADAQVLCRQLGYKDGIVNYDVDSSLPTIKRWVTGFFCHGNEGTMMTCLNTGFNSTFLDDLCMFKEPGAYSACYNDKIEATDIRLVGGSNKFSGRVEVYVKGPNRWGTICDDFWDNSAAVVVCRHLGFTGGKAIKQARFGIGTGPIWFDNVRCLGNESLIFNCSHRGIGTHNCNHTEDVGVMCIDPTKTTTMIVPPSRTMTTSTTSTATSVITSTFTMTLPTTTSSKPTTQIHTTPKQTIQKTTVLKPTTQTTTTQKITTYKPTTSPTTFRPTTTKPTTFKPTTMKTTTQQITTQKTVTSTVSEIPSTSVNNTDIFNGTRSHKKRTSAASVNVGAVVAFSIVVIIIILTTVLAVVCFIKIRRLKKSDIPHERFHDDIIEHSQDGSLAMSNQLYDMSTMQPTSNGFASGDGQSKNDVTLTNNGSVYYSKPQTSETETANAFANPLYDQLKTENISGTSNSADGLEDVKEINLSDTVEDSQA